MKNSQKAGPQKGKQRPDHNFEKGGTRAGYYKRDDILTCNGSVWMLRTDYRRGRTDQSGGSQSNSDMR